jgi:glycosyltransferase involved in cell wall biosynthesis
MNILLLRHYNPYTESGASANRFRGLVEGLCREGHSVTIGIVGGELHKGEAASFKHDVEGLRVEYLSHSNHYHPLCGRLNTYFFDDLIHLPAASRDVRKLLKEQRFDIVWLTNQASVLGSFRKVQKQIKGRTFIELNEFNDIYKEEKEGNFLQRRKGARDNRMFLDTIGKIDLFAVMTKTLTEHYRQMAKPEAKFMLLPMTVDMTRFMNVKDTVMYNKPYIAFTGTMSNQKDGVDVLIKAFIKNAVKYPDLHLYLAGFWHYDVPAQDKLIEESGVSNRIHRLGVLEREQIPPFVCNARVLALSRPNSHQAQGGFPTKLGEYLATGNPVCVTKVGEIPDYLEDNVSAFMAEPGSVESFADALDRAMGEKAEMVGTAGREVAEESFDVAKQARRLSEFLKSK